MFSFRVITLLGGDFSARISWFLTILTRLMSIGHGACYLALLRGSA